MAVANPLRSLAGDAAYVRDVIASIDGPVVLVGHSYGGLVISEASAGNDQVVGLVYASAFVPEPGDSAFSLSASEPGSTLGDALDAHPISTGGVELVIRRPLFRDQFAADVPVQVAGLMGATQRPVTEAALKDAVQATTPGLEGPPVMARVRQRGPQHPRRGAPCRCRTRRLAWHDRTRGSLARRQRLAARSGRRHDPRRDPRGDRGPSGRVASARISPLGARGRCRSRAPTASRTSSELLNRVSRMMSQLRVLSGLS